MTTHTPGPWYAYSLMPKTAYEGYRHGVANAKPEGVTKDEDGVLHVDFPDWNSTSEIIAKTTDSERSRANARLIAAAPDLLDFAARFEAAVGFLVAGLPTNHAVAKDLIGLRDLARAALSKAKGGEA